MHSTVNENCAISVAACLTAMLTAEQQITIINANKLGNSNHHIAKVVGCHRKTVAQLLAQHVDTSEKPEKNALAVLPSSPSKNASASKSLLGALNRALGF